MKVAHRLFLVSIIALANPHTLWAEGPSCIDIFKGLSNSDKSRIALFLRTFSKSTDYTATISAANELLQDYPSHEIILGIQANAFLKSQQFLEALTPLNLILKGNPTNPIALTMRSHALKRISQREDLSHGQEINDLIKGGNYHEALLLIEARLKFNPEDEVALGFKASALIQMSKKDPTAEIEDPMVTLNTLLGINPENKYALGMKAYLLKKQGQLEEALVIYDKIISIDPFDSIALGERAQALIKLSRFDEALATVKEKLRLNPQDEVGLGMLAQLYIYMSKLDLAQSTLNELFRFYPKNENAKSMQANIYILQGDSRKAIILLETLKKDRPVLWQLAHAYYNIGNMRESKKNIFVLIQKSKKVDIYTVAAWLKIEGLGGNKELNQDLFNALTIGMDLDTLNKVTQFKDSTFWSFIPTSIVDEVSIRNLFWSSPYHLEPVDGQTYRSTR